MPAEGRATLFYKGLRVLDYEPFSNSDMAKTRQEKEEILTRLREDVGSAASAVFVHFTGIPVVDEQKLRAQLREDGVSYFVAKKSLIGKAMGDVDIAGDMPSLEGEVAVAYNDAAGDPTAPARIAHQIGKDLGVDRFSILGGVFEKRFLNKDDMTEIATIPPMQVLRGMFANVINSPIQGLVVALDAVATKKEA